jgi:NAD(P)-dependent dehydrogenase (short-subunit alcohol dehydrogenase family)
MDRTGSGYVGRIDEDADTGAAETEFEEASDVGGSDERPSGRVWLVTGASSGFGRAITQEAAGRGDVVVAAARRLDAVADLVAEHPGRVHPVVLDVVEFERASEVMAEVVDRFGRVDVLVNNAGRGLVGAVEETSDRQLRDLMDVHFFGPVALTRAVLPYMRRQRAGWIVQISSMGGRMSFPGVGAYSASKFALEGISEALAGELMPLGVRVLIVEPGAFRTGLHGGGEPTVALPEYEEIMGPVRSGQAAMAVTAPGDPRRAAKAIHAVLDADKPPLRLVLGNDAVDAIVDHLDTAREEIRTWEATARATQFDD